MRNGRRQITIPMLYRHLVELRKQYAICASSDAGGLTLQSENRGALKMIDFIIDDIESDNPSMLKHTTIEVYEENARHTCGNCGYELQIVRPGKYQCVNANCKQAA